MRTCAILVAIALSSCASKQKWDAREVYVHTLPANASIAVDGKVQGTSPVSAVIPPGERVAGGGEAPAQLTASLPGYAASQQLMDRRHLPAEVMLVLGPVVNGTTLPAPGWQDARALADVGGQLAAARRCAEALQYLERALGLETQLAVAHRDAGRCYRLTGRKPEARQHLGSYLMMVPEAPDARQVRMELDAIDGSRTIDLGKPR